MFGEHHDLTHEFPEYKELIIQLRQSSSEFSRMMDEYEDLDERILRAEQRIEPHSDFYDEELKRQRVHLKDQLYTQLRNFSG